MELPLRRWKALVFKGQPGYVPNKWALEHVHTREERFVCGSTGRQVGKSSTATIEIDTAMNQPADEFGPPWVGVLATDFKHAKILIDNYVTMLTETFGPDSYRMNQNDHELVILDQLAGTQGARLTWLSAENEYGVVGPTFSFILIDEAQGVSDRVYMKFIPTGAVRKAKVRVFGTPDITAEQTWFQGMWFRGQDPQEKNYHSYTVASWDTGWMDMEQILQDKRQMTENEFRRLYGGEWVNEDGQFFTNWEQSMLDAEPAFDPFRRYVMSVDLAVEDDYNYVIIGDVSTKTCVHRERWNNTEPIDTYERIYGIWLKYGRPRTIADYTGLGIPMVKELQQRGIPVIPFTWNVQTKMPTLGQLSADLQHRRIMFPRSWDDMQRELKGFIRKKTPSGLMTASAASGFYDDGIMSLALLNELFRRSGSGGSSKQRNYMTKAR